MTLSTQTRPDWPPGASSHSGRARGPASSLELERERGTNLCFMWTPWRLGLVPGGGGAGAEYMQRRAA